LQRVHRCRSTFCPRPERLAAQPVAFYAAVFSLVNLTYIFLIRELIDRPGAPDRQASGAVRRSMHVRSLTGMTTVP